MPYEPKDAEYLKMIPGSATYDEIKEYVLKKYNVKVSSLYVAQVIEEDTASLNKLLDWWTRPPL